jgi:RimJ/RimL family protein N-acetyltransferase
MPEARASLHAAHARQALGHWLQGPDRLAFDITGVQFTQFELADAADLLAVRNHDSVRRFMPQAQPLAWEAHLRWAQAHLCNGDVLLFMARRDGVALGFSLLKLLPAEHELELGVMFAGERQRTLLPGLAATHTCAIALEVFGAQTVVTYASPDNEGAIRLNQGLGLLPSQHSDKPGEQCFRTPVGHVRQLPIYRRSLPQLRASLRVMGAGPLAWAEPS